MLFLTGKVFVLNGICLVVQNETGRKISRRAVTQYITNNYYIFRLMIITFIANPNLRLKLLSGIRLAGFIGLAGLIGLVEPIWACWTHF